MIVIIINLTTFCALDVKIRFPNITLNTQVGEENEETGAVWGTEMVMCSNLSKVKYFCPEAHNIQNVPKTDQIHCTLLMVTKAVNNCSVS